MNQSYIYCYGGLYCFVTLFLIVQIYLTVIKVLAYIFYCGGLINRAVIHETDLKSFFKNNTIDIMDIRERSY